MIFLLVYNRKQGKIVEITPFPNSDRTLAQDHRLELELSQLISGLDNEVVLLEADDEMALRSTHSRYFLNPSQIAST